MPDMHKPEENLRNRIGFHYYPDALHYRKEDLEVWLPRLKFLGASWITLIGHESRAIPEFFIKTLIENLITPVIQVPCNADMEFKSVDLRPILTCYAKWGIQYIAFYDRPNLRESWRSTTWSQSNLVEQFLDRFLPVADALLDLGLTPVFPPLEPGGDYWDTIFLNQALKIMLRRGYKQLTHNIVLGVNAWTYGKPISWGKGGPVKWQKSRPYFTPDNHEDHIGFNIYEWYQSQALETLGHPVPIILVRAGCRTTEFPNDRNSQDPSRWHADQNRLIGEIFSNSAADPSENHILACNFWLLASGSNSSYQKDAWYPENNRPLPVVEEFARLNVNFNGNIKQPEDGLLIQEPSTQTSHYILIPASTGTDEALFKNAAGSYTQRKKAALGNSLDIALHARRVTILGYRRWMEESYFEKLRSQGCMIEEVYGSGTQIATKLENL